jgi:pyrroline-5-carboxylate reductase
LSPRKLWNKYFSLIHYISHFVGTNRFPQKKHWTRFRKPHIDTMTNTIGFIGSGMMASSLADGIVAKGLRVPNQIHCSDIYAPAREAASDKGYNATESNEDVCKHSVDAIFLAVKPNCIMGACKDISDLTPLEKKGTLIISIAAGITLAALEKALPERRIVRVMPNTPCLVGEAACGFSLGSLATDDDRTLVKTLLDAVGISMEVPETLLDAVTGLSGSGPAYVFQFIEALSDGGVRAGLPRNVATMLAAQTVKGAAEMVLKTGKHPGELKDAVTSPGGTTIAGVEALEKG